MALSLEVGLAPEAKLIGSGGDLDNYLYPVVRRLGAARFVSAWAVKRHGRSRICVQPAVSAALHPDDDWEFASARFCDHGYPATTVEMIATAASVAPQTVHYVFRTKAALLREVTEVAAAGEHEPAPVMERPWIREALGAPDGRRALALGVEHGVDIYVRVAPLNRAIHAAVSIDPDVDDYWRSVSKARRRGMGEVAAVLAANQQLRPELTVERATDLMFVLNSHETFLGLTRDSGWSLKEFKAWLYITLCHQLLQDDQRTASHAAQATEDLSFHHHVADR